MLELTVFIVKDKESGMYVVTCPALKGCVSQGTTEEEAVKNIREAIIGWLAVQNDRATREAKKSSNHAKELALQL